MNFIHDKRHKKEKGNGFLPERRSAGPVGVISFLHSYPLSLAALASSPKGTPLSRAGNFTVTAKSRPLGQTSPGRGKMAKPERGTGGIAAGDDGRGIPARSAALSQKAALQMPFSSTTYPVKKGF